MAISLDRARRIALQAQGLSDPRPSGRANARHFRRVVSRVGLVQLDSVNVFSRAHYLPFFSRLGPYDRTALDRWLWGSGELFEYWGHEASLIPVAHHHLLRHRMEGGWHWGRIERMLADRPGYLEAVLEEVKRHGPMRTSELTDPGTRDTQAMWGWSDGKVALEALFLTGQVAIASRPNFTRLYDLAERVLPPEVLAGEAVEPDEARAELLMIAARGLGVATGADLADYHRIRMPQARPLLDGLARAGRLEKVEVAGWSQPAYLHPEAAAPRKVEGSALLSPFDSLVWCRPRVERLFGFEYRIEIYVPAPKRRYGYYVLPYLLDGRLVARVDLKSDRAAGALRVQGSFAEPGVDRVAVARELAADLAIAAGWLGLGSMVVAPNGDLAGELGRAS